MAAAATGDGSDRDLKIKETTITSESENCSSILTESNEEMLDLASGLLASNKPTADAHGTKRKEATSASSEASASEDGAAAPNALKKKEGDTDSLFKEGEMLKLREEYWEAYLLWKEEREKAVWGAPLERKTTQVPVAAVDTKQQKKKVIREILPDGYIAYISENSCMMTEISEEEMAECPEPYRQSYAMTKIINAKKLAYHQALIDQHRAFGYAYDEKEVTDEDEEAVVKN